MDTSNLTNVNYFIIMGLTSDPHLQVPLFIFFLLVYIITMVGNIGFICLYHIDSHLHKPMYLFISNLSFVDLCCSTTITPKLLMGFIVHPNVISFNGCATQLFFLATVSVAESLVISLMSLDRYTAVCKPLHYTVLMTEMVCVKLAVGAYVFSFMCAIMYTAIIFSLSYCGENKIDHYFCDATPLFIVSCTDTSLNEVILFISIAIVSACNIISVAVSYFCILIAILKIRSSAGRRKVFSTCSSHLFCIVLFYGTCLNIYMRRKDSPFNEKDKVMSVGYTIIIAMLNPLIYSLRNKDVKAAFWRTARYFEMEKK